MAEVLSYLVVSTNAPLIDDRLAHWDRAIGFFWPRYFLWSKTQPILEALFAFVYGCVIIQIGIVIVYLAATRRHRALLQFNSVFVLCGLIAIALSGFFPARGPIEYYANLVHGDASMLSHFAPLRAGTLRVIFPIGGQGLISMPSVHAVMAVLLAYGMRGTRLRALFLILNALVLASTPTRGGHYLVDVIAGTLLVAVVIALWNAIDAIPKKISRPSMLDIQRFRGYLTALPWRIQR